MIEMIWASVMVVVAAILCALLWAGVLLAPHPLGTRRLRQHG